MGQKSRAFSAAELKALERQILGKRRQLWLRFAAVFVPLLVLIGLQYLWLLDLEKSSAIAYRASLQKFLESVAKEVSWYYGKNAERALNVPDYGLQPEYIHKCAHFFKKKEIEGVKRLFVVSFLDRGRTYFFDPGTAAMFKPEHTPEAVAVWAATAPWSVLHKKGGVLPTIQLSVDERDPDNRIILNPITDEDSQLIGLAGMIVEREFFEDVLLPKAVAATMPVLAPEDELVVCVRDHEGRTAFELGGTGADCEHDEVHGGFSFIFTDWSIGLQGDYATPEKWAKANFSANLSLFAVLVIVLLGGTALALRAALREMRLSAMKNEFVSNVSHELRTPLSSIRVFGEFMRRGRVTEGEKVREYGEYIEGESRRLTQLINNILDFSRIESGRRDYSFEEADLDEVVRETLNTFGVRLRNQGFELDYREPEAELPPVLVDPGAIDRAIANLLDNAVKYSGADDSGKTIAVTLGCEGDDVFVAITDQGIGIPRAEQKRIFERFHRVSTGLVHDVKGTGLGLSLVRHIVQAHSGRVAVVSEVGKGSTFTIYLPAFREEA